MPPRKTVQFDELFHGFSPYVVKDIKKPEARKRIGFRGAWFVLRGVRLPMFRSDFAVAVAHDVAG